jgi:preprotein translocase subunit SecD
MVPFDAEQAITPDVQEQARGVMEARAREMGLTNFAVRSEEPDLLIVELRGESDSDETRRALVQNGFLEIVDSGSESIPEGTIIVTSEGGPTFEEGAPQSLKAYPVVVTGRDIAPDRVTSRMDELTGQPIVTLGLNEQGTKKFADYTAANVGNYMAVAIDKRVLSSPSIQAPIPSGDGGITGLTEPQARQLVAILRAGLMPTKLELIETQQLGTSTNP